MVFMINLSFNISEEDIGAMTEIAKAYQEENLDLDLSVCISNAVELVIGRWNLEREILFRHIQERVEIKIYNIIANDTKWYEKISRAKKRGKKRVNWWEKAQKKLDK